MLIIFNRTSERIKCQLYRNHDHDNILLTSFAQTLGMYRSFLPCGKPYRLTLHTSRKVALRISCRLHQASASHPHRGSRIIVRPKQHFTVTASPSMPNSRTPISTSWKSFLRE